MLATWQLVMVCISEIWVETSLKNCILYSFFQNTFKLEFIIHSYVKPRDLSLEYGSFPKHMSMF